MTLRFAWYDLWVGAFYDRKNRVLYVCPLPCALLTFRLRQPKAAPLPGWRGERIRCPIDCHGNCGQGHWPPNPPDPRPLPSKQPNEQGASSPCCEDGPPGHSRQEHHDASPCYDQACPMEHPNGGPFPHPCNTPLDKCPHCGGVVGADDCEDCGWKP